MRGSCLCKMFVNNDNNQTTTSATSRTLTRRRRRRRTMTQLVAHNGKLLSLALFLALTCWLSSSACQAATRDYYYTRTRQNAHHLRVSEESKNNYVNDIKYESRINGTSYQYYKSSLSMSHDELVFETIDKIFRHRLSPFYIHHYDNEQDRRDSSDASLVSAEACGRHLMYLVDKLPNRQRNPTYQQPMTTNAAYLTEEPLSPELSAFFDSYGRQEAGLLMGNTYWVGSYDQCVNRHIFDLTDTSYHQQEAKNAANLDDKQAISFQGRYCVASLKSATWDAAIKAKKLKAKNYFKTERQFEDYAKLFRIQVGICLPSSCDSNTLERHADEIKLLSTHLLEQRFKDYHLFDLYCIPDEASPLRAWTGSSLYFMVFMLVWSVGLFFATLADFCGFLEPLPGPNNQKSPKLLHKLVVLFSLRSNYRKLMRVAAEQSEPSKAAHPKQPEANCDVTQAPKKQHPLQPPDIQINLRFLNAFKALVMFWIINGHIMLLMIQTAKNILYSDALLNGLMHFLIGATFGVDLFFTMTGFLTSYLIFNSGHAFKMKPFTWIYLSFHRYWRLAPMYFLAFWFSRSVAQRLGSGPLWDYGTSSLTFRGLCNHESWWYPLTLTSNLHGLFEECMITSWYISCDMQFWLVSPIFIHLLAKKPSHGWIAALSAIVMSSKARFDAIASDQSARYDELVQPRADIFMRVSHDMPALYTHPHHRISAYLVGLLAGHYVYMIKSGKWRSSVAPAPAPRVGAAPEAAPNKSRSSMANLGVFAFLVMAFISYLLNHYYPSSLLKHAPLAASLAHSIGHLIMSIGASLVIISMCFGQWAQLVRWLSHPAWTRLSKLNYALLLLQCEAIYFQIFRYDQVPVAGTKELINILFNLLVTLYPAAFAVTLAFEYPLANLEKLLH